MRTKEATEERRRRQSKTLPRYSVSEEFWNFVTHGIGAVFAIFAAVFLMVASSRQGQASVIFFMLIYSLTLINLFSFSAVYHGSGQNLTLRRRAQKGDHLSISITLAGMVTAVVGGALDSAVAYILVALAWVFAGCASVMNLLDVKKYRAQSMVCYVATALLPFTVIAQLHRAMGTAGVILFVLSGVLVGAGIVFYGLGKNDKKRLRIHNSKTIVVFARRVLKKDYKITYHAGREYYHTIWHLLTLSAAALNFAAIMVGIL